MNYLIAGYCIRPVRNNLVCIHVRLRARPRLPYNKRKMVVKLARNHLVARFSDCGKLLFGHFFGLKLGICKRRRLFENSECVRYLARHGFNPDAYLKILMASLRLRRPKLIRRNLNLAHGIMLNSVFHN